MADEYEFLIELLTYNCPITGKKRCAAAASLENPNTFSTKKLATLELAECLIVSCCWGLIKVKL